MKPLTHYTTAKPHRTILSWLVRTLLVAIGLVAFSAYASGGDDHSHGPSQPETATGKNYFSVEASSEKHELLLRYVPIKPGQEASLQLFISEYLTNRPVKGTNIKLASAENDQLQFTITPLDNGYYEIKTVFPQVAVYNIAVSFSSNLGPDLILLQNIEVGKELPVAEEEHDAWYTQSAMVFFGGLAAGIMVMFFLMRFASKRARATTLLVVFLFQIPANQFVLAHEGHGDENKKGNNFSTSFEVPKETQFLFEVTTQPVQAGVFTETTRLYGTVMPSSAGQAIVQSPQTGKLTSISVQVGQRVFKGQLLATLEPSVDAGNTVAFLAERNNTEAELEAAKQEYERLKSIEDIAAKRDVAEADARYKKALHNKALYERLASGQPDQARSIRLHSPIDGIISNFTFSIGSSITASEPIFSIINLDKVYVEAQVFDKDAANVNAGKSFEVECATNTVHKTAEVKMIAPAQSINPTNQTQRVLFEMQNHGNEFKIGEFVYVRVFAPQATHEISLANDAIGEINGKPVVFIKDGSEKYSVSYVSLGHNNGTHTIIKKGIEEGERVVIHGAYQMKMIYLNQ
jgi:membrane fusion protein, heavy metal efflux system